MPFLIDGHNLIAQMEEISLDDPEDEVLLMSRLHSFCLRTGKRVTVYFDRRSPGSSDPPLLAGLSVHFMSPPQTADQAIERHLQRLGREARNWTVVSSDREVRAAAQQSGAQSLSSRDFAQALRGEVRRSAPSEKPRPPISDEEIARWERLFRRRDENP